MFSVRNLLFTPDQYSTARSEEELSNFKSKIDEIIQSKDLKKTWNGTTNSYAWWKSALNGFLLPDLLTFDFPIYLAHGTLDKSVPVESAIKVYETFKDQGKMNLTFNRYAGLDHMWSDSHKKSFADMMIKDLLDWLKGLEL